MFEQIKKDRDTARKARDQFTLTILSTVIGEVELKHRSGQKAFADVDQVVQKVIKSTIESCQEMSKLSGDQKSLDEIAVLEKYLEQTMSVEEIKSILETEQFAELKNVMQHFKGLGKAVDMKQVRELFMEMSK